MHSNHTIAGVVLTLNEEQDLVRALRSLAWCDELLVVDSGSSDRTSEVANQCGARYRAPHWFATSDVLSELPLSTTKSSSHQASERRARTRSCSSFKVRTTPAIVWLLCIF